MRAIVVCLLLAVVAVSGDLYSDFDDIAREMPMKEISVITDKYYKNSQSFREYIAYMKSQYDQVFNDIFGAKEMQDLFDYFQGRGIDFKRIVLNWLEVSKELYVQQVDHHQSAVQARFGLPISVGNYIYEINIAMSESKIPDLIREKLETSSEFANYIEAVKDPEFQKLFSRLVSSKVFTNHCEECSPQVRGFFSKVWKKIKDIGFGIGVSIPLGK